MSARVTHEDAIVPSSDLIAVSSAADIAEATSLENSEAEKLLAVAEKRAKNRADGSYDIIVVLEGWAYEPWSDYDIAQQPAMLVGHVEDYSEKAYKARGAFEVQMDLFENKSLEETRNTVITSLVEEVDETNEDFINERGEKFLPKSAVETILVVEE